MKNAILLPFAFLAAFFLASCGEKKISEITNQDELMERQISIMNEFTDILAGIKDVDSAKAAKGKLDNIVLQMNSMSEQIKKLGFDKSEVKKKMEEKYKPEIEKFQKNFMTVMQNLGKQPESIKVIEDVLSKMTH